MRRRSFLKTLGLGLGATALSPQSALASDSFVRKRYPAIKPIIGSWFEFRHNNLAEGKYWNATLKNFTEDNWKEKIREISEAGMEYLVLMGVAGDDEAFYESQYLKSAGYQCKDPLEAVLSAADECGIKFFIGNDFYGDWRYARKMMTDKNVAMLREKGMNEVAEKYGHHKSFYGWYFPNESGLFDNIDDMTIEYVNNCSRIGKQLIPNSVNIIAPYGTNTIRTDDEYVRRLEKIDIDIIAYQDEIGVRKTKVGEAGKYFEGLYKAHAKAGRARLWADIELFEFEDVFYKSALIPASFDRVLQQLEDISPFVEHILVYQFQGMMNKPGSKAFAGHPDSTKLYSDYMEWYHNRL